jgi:hypothetical protein
MASHQLARKSLLGIAVLGCIACIAGSAFAQPLVDSLHALQQRNEKMYRMLNAMDDRGASYQFTNVTAWHVTDDDLSKLIKQVYMDQYGTKQLKDFDIGDIYIFAAPTSTPEVYEPFHVLFVGQRVKQDTSGGGADIDPFFAKKRGNTNAKINIAFKGKDVVRLMHRQPALLDQINAIQGEIVELPGDILPSGAQLVKSAAQRYIFHKMFDGFYSKREIIDEQNIALGLPTADESFAATDTSGNAGPDPNAIPVDPEATAALPDEQYRVHAFKYDKTVDISNDHVLVNVAKNTDVEVQLGLPEVGLPFWSAGLGRFWLNLKNQVGNESNFALGFVFPLDFGNSSAVVYNARQISGGIGGSVNGYFSGIDFFSAFNMPVAFNFTIMPSGGSNSSILYNGAVSQTTIAKDGSTVIVPANRTFYRTGMIGQLYFPIIVQLDPANFLQFSAGIGLDQVYQSWIPTSNDTKASANQFHPIDAGQQDKIQDLVRVSTPVTPHIGLEYVNHRANKFGLNMYYDHLFTFGGWIELIEDHLRLETSYTAPLVRDPKPYEPAYFFQLTPRIYF